MGRQSVIIMVRLIEQRIQSEAYAIIVRQLIGVSILSTLIFGCFGQQSAMPFLLGGIAYSLPDLLFIWRFIRYKGLNAVSEFMGRFVIGKVVKLILRSVLLVVAVKQLPANSLWIVIGFVSCPFLFWIASISILRKSVDVR